MIAIKRNPVKINTLACLLCLLLALALASVSCAPKTIATTNTTTKSVTTTSKTTVPVTTTPTTAATTKPATTVATTPTVLKTTTTPALEQTAFNLLITPPQTYAEYTLPVYLTADDTIHLVWTVSGIGDHIRMAVNTPDGQYVGIKANGGFIVTTAAKPCDELYRSGSIVLKPGDQKWVEGYYIFHPYIVDNDAAVNVKIMYWIEH